MAEYIDRALALREVKRWENGITVNIKAELKALPPADVIERSKIDNALADMQTMLDQEVLSDNVISDVGQGIAIAMGLLRTNIGE